MTDEKLIKRNDDTVPDAVPTRVLLKDGYVDPRTGVVCGSANIRPGTSAAIAERLHTPKVTEHTKDLKDCSQPDVLISKEFDFDAAHRLPHLPADHKCFRMHGHTYRVRFKVRGVPQEDGPERGMVIDYARIALAWQPIRLLIDHQTLNEIPGLENPTTEVLAKFLLNAMRFAGIPVVTVRVYESSTTYCEAFYKAGSTP